MTNRVGRMTNRKKYPVHRNDHFRALLTETMPDDVPIVFSNFGFYRWVKSWRAANRKSGSQYLEKLLEALFDKQKGKPSPTIPYTYPIFANQAKVRKVSLVHPRVQLKWCLLYKDYANLIAYYCQRSDSSLRAPCRITSTTYLPNAEADRHRFRLQIHGVDTVESDSSHKHPISFFAYSGYRRYYEFFDTELFMRLEIRFPILWILDIANCFHSIYTHAIAWALKSKEYTKRHLNMAGNTFAGKFDEAMRSANWGETNGIVIGPEISRIFAELILQSIEIDTKAFLHQKHRISSKEYRLFRYVDDYFIFAQNENIAKQVRDSLAYELSKHNLFLNPHKRQSLVRPFITRQSIAIESARTLLSHLWNQLVIYRGDGSNDDTCSSSSAATGHRIAPWSPRRIPRPRALKASFIRQFRAAAATMDSGYAPVSSFTINALTNRVVDICRATQALHDIEKKIGRYVTVAALLLDISFFVYALEPTVATSIRLANAAIVALRVFSPDQAPEHFQVIQRVIYDGCVSFVRSHMHNATRPRHVTSIELLNIVSILGQLDDEHEVPWEVLRQWLQKASDSSDLSDIGYFGLTVALHYARDRSSYAAARDEIGSAISSLLSRYDKQRAMNSTLFAHLLLDALSCPYLDRNVRGKILRKACNTLEILQPRSPTDENALLESFEKRPFFIDWHDIDLTRSLERKSSVRAY